MPLRPVEDGPEWSPQDRVELFGLPARDGRYMHFVRDLENDRWMHFPDPEQDFVYPGGEPFQITAIVDTGVVTEHPRLRGRVLDQVDFTGEGPEDHNGHGTAVALLAMRRPGAATVAGLLNVKITTGSGEATADNLVRAFNWLSQYHRSNPKYLLGVVLSAGVYRRRRMGLLPCNGSCDVCTSAMQMCSAGWIHLTAACGNDPERTACPATAARLGRFPNMVAVSLPDSRQGANTYTMPGNGEGAKPMSRHEEILATLTDHQRDQYLVDRAQVLIQHADVDGAEALYKDVVAQGSTSVARDCARVMLALLYVKLERDEEANDLLSPLVDRSELPQNILARINYGLGILAFRQGRDRQAKDYLTAAGTLNDGEMSAAAAPLLAHLLGDLPEQ